MPKPTNANIDICALANHWARLYDIFPDRSGAQLAIRALRIMYPEIPDTLIARIMGADEKEFQRYIQRGAFQLVGDPSLPELNVVSTLLLFTGPFDILQSRVAILKAVTEAAVADLLGMQYIIENIRSGYVPGEDDGKQAICPVSGRPIPQLPPELSAALAKNKDMARRWIRALPVMLIDAGSIQQLYYVLDTLLYLYMRSNFDRALVDAVHANADNAAADSPIRVLLDSIVPVAQPSRPEI